MSDDLPAPPRRRLFGRGFIALFATQYCSAAGDNVVKGTIAFAVGLDGPWSDRLGPGGQGLIAILFALPFVLLSAFGGRLADRFSKRSSTIGLNLLSLAIAIGALVAFASDSLAGAVTALVLFAASSAFYGPVKYGMIAELVEREDLGRANALINVGTNIAVITGTIVAGWVATHFVAAHAGGPSIGWWLPGIVLVTSAVLGVLTCLPIPKLAAQDPDLPLDPNPFTTYVESLRRMGRGPLIGVALAWTFFYFLAAVVLSMLADYPALLGVDPLAASGLSAGMAVAIGVGCVAAGWLSGARLRLEFVPLGGAGLALAFLLLGLAPLTMLATGALLVLLGLVAGFYIIPLQSALQALAPPDQRGRFLGTANALSFVMTGAGSLLFWLLSAAGMPSNRMHLVLAGLTAIASCAIVAWLRRNRVLIAARSSLAGDDAADEAP